MTRREPNKWEDMLIHYCPLLTLPVAIACLVMAIATINAEARVLPRREAAEMCQELAYEVHQSYQAGLLTEQQAISIIERCYKDFVEQPIA